MYLRRCLKQTKFQVIRQHYLKSLKLTATNGVRIWFLLCGVSLLLKNQKPSTLESLGLISDFCKLRCLRHSINIEINKSA